MQYQQAIILDDHQLFSEAFANLLKASNKFESVTCVQTIEEVNTHLATKKVSHFFTDYTMPQINTLSEIRRIKNAFPDLRIIVVSSITNATLIYQIQKSGAEGFISKNAGKNEVDECLSTLTLGKSYLSPSLRGAMLDIYMNGQDQLFTAREHEILQHIALGDTIDATAQKLHLSKHTIVAHRRNMMEKVGVNSVSALLKKAMDMGVV